MAALDSRFRAMTLPTLTALRLSMITQIAAVQGTGQSHSLNGRQTALPDLDKLIGRLADIDAAIAFKSNPANAGNNGYASRYASFNVCGQGGDVSAQGY